MTTPIVPPSKICTKCGIDKPLGEYHKQKTGKYGRRADCAICRVGAPPYMKSPRPRFADSYTDVTPGEKRCAVCKEVKPVAHFHKAVDRRDGLRSECKLCAGTYRREQLEADRVGIEAYRRYIGREDTVWANHTERNINAHRRRERLENLPHNFTEDDYHRMMDYFKDCCVYCGQREGWEPLHLDHYIPVASDDCPGTIPSNIVPACKRCNVSKGAALPQDWLSWRFKRSAAAIIMRIQEYFDSLAK